MSESSTDRRFPSALLPSVQVRNVLLMEKLADLHQHFDRLERPGHDQYCINWWGQNEPVFQWHNTRRCCRGADADALPLDKRTELYHNFDTLERLGKGKEYIEGGSKEGLGKFEVMFVGEKQALSSVNQTASSPAGGYWRGNLARKILQTTALYQHVLSVPGKEVR